MAFLLAKAKVPHRTAVNICVCLGLLTITVLFAWYPSAIARFSWKLTGSDQIAILLGRNDAHLMMEIGNYYFSAEARDIKRAARIYERALLADPALLGPRYQLSRIAFLKNDMLRALALANEEFKLHPEFKRLHYLRGLIYGYIGLFAEAEEDFKEFLKFSPKSWAAHNDLAWIYFMQGKFQEVEHIARQGLAHNPGNPWLLNAYGAALLNLDRKDEAKIAFASAEEAAARLTTEEWGRAYPGNNPLIYERGLAEMRQTIKENLQRASK